MLNWLTLSVLSLLRCLHGLVHDWALSIVLLAALLWALRMLLQLLRGPEPAVARTALQRKIDELGNHYAKIFPSRRADHRAALLMLFREHRVGPRRLGRVGMLLGLLSSAAGLGILGGLLLVLYRRPELQGAPFLWIRDLTRPDVPLGLAICAPGILGILLTGKKLEPGARRAVIGLLLAEAITCVLLPAGFTLYQITSGLLGVLGRMLGRILRPAGLATEGSEGA